MSYDEIQPTGGTDHNAELWRSVAACAPNEIPWPDLVEREPTEPEIKAHCLRFLHAPFWKFGVLVGAEVTFVTDLGRGLDPLDDADKVTGRAVAVQNGALILRLSNEGEFNESHWVIGGSASIMTGVVTLPRGEVLGTEVEQQVADKAFRLPRDDIGFTIGNNTVASGSQVVRQNASLFYRPAYRPEELKDSELMGPLWKGEGMYAHNHIYPDPEDNKKGILLMSPLKGCLTFPVIALTRRINGGAILPAQLYQPDLDAA